jgi:hypothetical protein
MSPKGLSPSLAGRSKPVRFVQLVSRREPYNPTRLATYGLGWSPFARRY